MTTDDVNPRFTPFKCPTCNGYGSTSYGKNQCRSCKTTGVVVVDQQTGLIITNDDDENTNNQD